MSGKKKTMFTLGMSPLEAKTCFSWQSSDSVLIGDPGRILGRFVEDPSGFVEYHGRFIEGPW